LQISCFKILDDRPQTRAVWLAFGWVLPSTYRPWETLLVYGIKVFSWRSPVTGRLQGRRRA
jgi:hypothetical protein